MSYNTKEKQREHDRRYYKENKEKFRLKAKRKHERRKLNGYYKRKYKNSTLEQKKKHSMLSAEWNKKNRKKANKYLKEYFLRRYKEPMFKLNLIMSTNIRKALNRKKNLKSWQRLAGYTKDDLVKHLEKQFDDKMNWGNHGSYWHIDHIKPKSWFNYTCPEDKEFKECWALSNLQPLEAKKNMRKGNKFIG